MNTVVHPGARDKGACAKGEPRWAPHDFVYFRTSEEQIFLVEDDGSRESLVCTSGPRLPAAMETGRSLTGQRLLRSRKRQEEKLRQKDDQIRKAYTDVIAAVTGGKLVLMTGEEIRQELGEPVIEEVAVGAAEELATARKILSAALDLEYQDGSGLFKRALLPFSEAITNAVKHGGGGSFQLRRLDGHAQLIIRDKGPGIDFANLPHATLMPGFSTCGTLGMGFMIMLNESARMLLSTRPGETFVVMEMKV